MMRLIYSMLIHSYGLAVRVASLFNAKARLWVDGRKGGFAMLEALLQHHDHRTHRIIWFHASSLGEFEQGRPIIERYREVRPDARILLTFFSPSGYEIRKNYDKADWVAYLPLDTPGNSRRFVSLVRPERAIFIKYDFWFNMLDRLHREHIPVYYVSSIFRKDQYIFRWYGSWALKQLKTVAHFFVQNEESLRLLREAGVTRVTCTGDTRFDRVYSIAQKRQSFPLIEQFISGHPVFVCGSTWPGDEAILFPWILQTLQRSATDTTALSRRKDGPDQEGEVWREPELRHDHYRFKFLVAPHDTSGSRILELVAGLGGKVIRYSQLDQANCSSADILIIDTVGILSQLYQYARIAYIGGGFGSGLHNIQEPITFGVPVFFGPGYHKFREAVDLVESGGVFTVTSSEGLAAGVEKLISDPELYHKTSDLCRSYVEQHRGATERIIASLGLAFRV